MVITDAVGVGLSQDEDSHYFTTSQSVLTIDPGEAGTGTDRLDVDTDSQIHLSYESLNSTGISVSATETTATATGNDVNTLVNGFSGTGQVIDRLTTTNLSDTVTNNSSLGMVVDLGGSTNADADTFTGSYDPDAFTGSYDPDAFTGSYDPDAVDLGGSTNADPDTFTGSYDPDAIDILDARDVYNLDFSSASDPANYDVRVLGTNQSNEQVKSRT